MKDGTLYRKKMDSDRTTELHQLIVPSSMVPDVLNAFHPAVGHVTLECTITKTAKHFFWPSMNRDITNYSMSCSLCPNTRTCSDSTSVHETPSFTVQKAVCAITELTKDFINTTKQHPSMKRRQTHNRKRRHPSRAQQKSTVRDHPQPHTSSSRTHQYQTPSLPRSSPRKLSTISSLQ